MPLPLFKLGALLAKQISKPLGKILKEKAKQNDSFKKYFVVPAADLYHNIDITLRMRILGLGSPDKVPPMTEKAAIELGGDILSEFFVFGTAVALVLIEYARQASNKTIKDNQLHLKVTELDNECIQLKEKLDSSLQRLSEISTFVQEQKNTITEMNNKINVLTVKKRYATQAVQTTNGKQIGKVMQSKMPSESIVTSDVTDSIIFQCTESAVNEIVGKT